MRIADKMTSTQVDRQIQKNKAEMANQQNQAATQKRVSKPSDDPSVTTRVLSARTDENSYKQYIQSIVQAKSFIDYTEQALSELSDSLVRAKELAIGQASDAGAGEETRKITAEEVSQIFQQSVQIGNRKLGDRYIFSGLQTLTQPFDQRGEYFGDSGDIKIQIHKDAHVGMNLAGSKVFLGEGVSGDGIIRASSVNPKTVNELNEMRQEDQQLQKIKQDEEFNQVQTRSLASTGSTEKISKQDPISNSRGVNVFQTLKGLEISLRTNDKAGVQESLDMLDQAISQVVLARSELGSRVTSLNATSDSLQKAVLDNKAMASQMEDADIFKLVSDINRTESTLKATMETSGKMVQRSLLDFLR